jgi:hypothetical protein
LCGEHLHKLYTVYLTRFRIHKNCFTTPNKNLGREGASDRQHLPPSTFTGQIFLKRHLGFESISYLVERPSIENEPGRRQRFFSTPHRTVQCTLSRLFIQDVFRHFRVGYPAEAYSNVFGWRQSYVQAIPLELISPWAMPTNWKIEIQ